MRTAIVGLLLLWPLASCALPPSGALPNAGPLEAVESLDLERYLGTWYEIARYPNWFEEGLVGATAEYRLREDGEIDVINTGRQGSLDGERSESTAVAWVPDPHQPAKLLVQFFWPFRGDYWVIALDEDYGWAVVGEPSRRFLWILGRAPQMGDDLYEAILEDVRAAGYDVDRLERIPQAAAG